MAPASSSLQKNISGTWEATFPAKQETLSESTLFMKRMLYVGFTQIIFSRELLPANCFKKRKFDHLRLYVFNTHSEEAFDLADQLRSVCETLEKGYLKELHLLIGDESKGKEEIIELYKMGVNYSTDKPSVTLSSDSMEQLEIQYAGTDQVKEQTRDLIIRIRQVTDKLAPLPEELFYKFYIVYDDDKTPKGYQARLFSRQPDPYVVSPDAQRVALGNVHAKHHACQFEISSAFIEDPVSFEKSLDEEISAIKERMRSDLASTDTTLDDGSPKNLLNDSLSVGGDKDKEESATAAKGLGAGADSRAGVKDLVKKTAVMKIKEKEGAVSASSPEEGNQPKAAAKTRKAKDKSVSPSKVLKKSKDIRKTPGTVNKMQKPRRTRA